MRFRGRSFLVVLVAFGMVAVASGCGATDHQRIASPKAAVTSSTVARTNAPSNQSPTIERSRAGRPADGESKPPSANSGHSTARPASPVSEDSYRFRFAANGVSGVRANGHGGEFPTERDGFWRVQITPAANGRVLDWTAVSGSPETRREHPITFAGNGILGVALHRALYGTAPNVSPPPMIVPRTAAPGDVFEGDGTGSFVEEGYTFSVKVHWRLTVVSETTVRVRGVETHAWNVHREVVEVVSEAAERKSPGQEGSVTNTIVSDEVIPESLGFPISASGTRDASNNPVITDHMTFKLSLEE